MVRLFLALYRFERAQLRASISLRLLPVMVFLLLLLLQVFAAGELPAQTASALLCSNLAFSLILVHPYLWQEDQRDGTLALLQSHRVPPLMLSFSKMIALFLGYGVPLLLAVIPAIFLLNLSFFVMTFIASLLLILSLVPLLTTIASLAVGSRMHAILAPFLLLPLALPPLLAATGICAGMPFALWFAGALVFFLWGICPWLTAFSL